MMRRRQPDSGRRGFTLIELLVVVTVMMILMSLIVAGAAQLKRRALSEGSKAICQALVVAIDAYQNDYRTYPALYPARILSGLNAGELPYVPDLFNSAAFTTQYADAANNFWKPEAANASVVFQLLQPIGSGPYVDPSSSVIPLMLPKDKTTKQPVSITITPPLNSNSSTLIRVAADKFGNPLNVTWNGSAIMYSQGSVINPKGVPMWGYWEWEATGANFTFTPTNDPTHPFTFTSANLLAVGNPPTTAVMLEITGLRVWSSGPDGIVDTHDDLDAAVAGR